MNRLSIALVAAIFTTPVALAGGNSGVEFSYDASAPTAESYIQLAETAKEACRIEYRGSAMKASWGGVLRACEADLMNDVIAQIGDRDLASLHNGGVNAATFISVSTEEAQ